MNLGNFTLETGLFEFDLDSINLHEGGEGTTATILEYKKRALTPKDEINENEKKKKLISYISD